MSIIVHTENLCKNFSFRKRVKREKAKRPFHWKERLVRSENRCVEAVRNLDLTIHAGESIAFIGPNGAGKSTTIKMLSGILTPTSGHLEVLGMNPVTERKKLGYRIGCVFGQRSQLLPNLPLADSFELFGYMYDLDKAQIQKRSAELAEIFSLQEFLHQPVRQLSLGQRMRGEIAASLVHSPEIIFLDEPTIGLDVVAKRELRQTLSLLNREQKTTVFLTSHDTGDIESLSRRLIVIDNGQMIIDAPTQDIRKNYLKRKYIRIDYAQALAVVPAGQVPALPAGFTQEGDRTLRGTINTEMASINDTLRVLLDLAPVEDVHLYDDDLEDIIIDIYRKNRT